MKHFIKRLTIFALPVLLYLIIAVSIDPYNILSEEDNPELSKLKSTISYKLNYPLYNIQKYHSDPTEAILLGDSRTHALSADYFTELTGLRSTNLACAGGTLPEILETFWFSAKYNTLKEVYIGINFNLYNATNTMNRVTSAKSLRASSLSYLFSKYCFKSCFYITRSLLTGSTIDFEKPNLNKAHFWRYQLESSANNFYRVYDYPSDYLLQLQEVGHYCQSKDIKLVFFIPPTHTDLQAKVQEFNLDNAEEQFKADLSSLALLYDFDYPNEMTRNKDNFLDPFHFVDTISRNVIEEIVTGKLRYARKGN